MLYHTVCAERAPPLLLEARQRMPPPPTPPVLAGLSQPSVLVLALSFGVSHVAAKPKIVWGPS